MKTAAPRQFLPCFAEPRMKSAVLKRPKLGVKNVYAGNALKKKIWPPMAKRIKIFFSLFWLASLTIHLSILLGLNRFSFSNEPEQKPPRPDSHVVWVQTKDLSLIDLPKPQK